MAEWDPFVRKTVRSANRIFASTTDTAERLKKMGAQNIVVQTQVGMTRSELKEAAPVGMSCRFISVGRMIHWKGFILGLKAFVKLKNKTAEFWFVGDGVCRTELEEFVQVNGLTDRVTFFGSLPREKVLEKISEADVLVHPSFHDSAGLVCLEAMALGKPVLCLNTGGPAELLDEYTGFKCSVDTAQQAIIELHSAMEAVSEDAGLRTTMGTRAVERVRSHFLWEKKAECFSNMYAEIAGNCKP